MLFVCLCSAYSESLSTLSKHFHHLNSTNSKSIFAFTGVAQAALPNLPDCHAAQDNVLDNSNPGVIFGETGEVGIKATPQRVGNLRQKTPLPTGHFATNFIKLKDVWPVILLPYECKCCCWFLKHQTHNV